MKVHVITAVSRPWNLALVARSLAAASRNAPDVDLVWHCRFDLGRDHVGGQQLKNLILDDITDGWVWILDDDTTAHENILERVAEVAESKLKVAAIIVSQRRVDGRVLHAHQDNTVVGSIDAGQAIIRRDHINMQIPDEYAGDGVWLETILKDCRIFYLDEVLSFHNLLSGVDDGPP